MKKFWAKIKKLIQITDSIKDKVEGIGVPVPSVVSKTIDITAELTKDKKKDQCPN
jgi:glyceraldehyde-3-phosphate dehydrogenase/erythrose-4-phosphate dehydrogenase